MRELYRHGDLRPLAEITTTPVRPPVEITEVPAAQGRLQAELRIALASGRVRDPAVDHFRPRLRFDDRRLNDPRRWFNGLIYSRWQLLAATALRRRLPLGRVFGSYERRRVSLPPLDGRSRQPIDRLAAWVPVLTALEALYLPTVNPEWLQLTNVEVEEWEEFRAAYDPVAMSEILQVKPAEIEASAESLLNRAHTIDPTGDWSRLIRRAPERAWKTLTGDALIAHDYRLAAEVLLQYYEDLLDLEAANALVQLAHETGADLAAVGDPNQALPVGHSGAMQLILRISPINVELADIHRFKDPAWAELTRELREGRGVRERDRIASRLIRSGHVTLVNSTAEALQTLVDGWFDATGSHATISIVTATHAEAQAVGEAIQARRIQEGSLDADRVAVGQSGQTLFEGDVAQTRRNDSRSGVENRQNWIISRISDDGILLTSTNDSTQGRRISHAYATGHLHLGYASTVYGAQGETTDRSIVGPGVAASGLYVGLTRGRHDNQAVLIAPTAAAATRELVDMLHRDAIEPNLEYSKAAARAELRATATRQSVYAEESGEVKETSQPSLSGSRSLRQIWIAS